MHLKTLLSEEADPSLPFLSMDIESLFTNVPVEPLLDFLLRKHTEGGVPLPKGYTIDGLLDLIRICVKSTVFSFNGKYYRQLQGVSMGNPLAPIIACLYCEYWETDLRLSLRCKMPSLWYRYIDDIILQWPHSLEDFNIFFRKILGMEPLIKLKVEWEALGPTPSGSASIPFLDIRIHRSLMGFTYSVYRKPTATDMYTHCYSTHPTNTKRGVLIGLFLRALRLCSTEHLEAETEHITRSFQRLKYPRYMIQQALSTAKSRFYNPVVRERPRSKYHLQLPCHQGMQALRPALANIGVSTSLSSSNPLRRHLSHTGPRAPAV